MGFLGHRTVLVQVCQGISKLFFIQVVPVCVTSNSVLGLNFCTAFPGFLACRISDDGHSEQCEMTAHYNFNFHLSNNE